MVRGSRHATRRGWQEKRDTTAGGYEQMPDDDTNSKLEPGSPLAQNGHLNRLASFCFPLAGACFFALLPIFQQPDDNSSYEFVGPAMVTLHCFGRGYVRLAALAAPASRLASTS